MSKQLTVLRAINNGNWWNRGFCCVVVPGSLFSVRWSVITPTIICIYVHNRNIRYLIHDCRLEFVVGQGAESRLLH